MEYIIVAVAAFIVGYMIGGAIRGAMQAMAFKNILQDLGVTTEQLLKLKDRIDRQGPSPDLDVTENVIEVRLEQHGNQIYAYRKDTEQFLGQGTDREALIQHLNLTFARGARLIVREADGAHLVKTL